MNAPGRLVRLTLSDHIHGRGTPLCSDPPPQANFSNPVDIGRLLKSRGEKLLASTKGILERDRMFPSIKWVAGALIISAISFNAALAFLHARGVAISSVHVISSETVLMCAAVVVCRNYLTPAHVSILVSLVFFTTGMCIIRYVSAPSTGFDPKIVRDILIPVVFFLLGKCVNDIRVADRVVFVALAALLVFAAFEYFFLDAYLRIFGIAEYYVARGSLNPADPALEISQGLMASGVRPTDQGRFLLPVLGDHRISSLFLEPSTLGNFGALVALWALVRSRMEGRFYACCALGGLALVVLSDTRFNAYFLVVAVAMLVAPPRLTTLFVFFLPFIIMLALYLFAASADPHHGIPIVEGREVGDRLLYSGRVLFDFDLYNWLGLAPSRAQTFNSGYGYVISNLGIIGFVGLWILFMSLEASSRRLPRLSQYHRSFLHRTSLHLGLAVHHQTGCAALVPAGGSGDGDLRGLAAVASEEQ